MSRRARRAPTLLESACRNVGWRLAAVAFVHVFQWAVVEQALGRSDFTMDELAEWWGMSRAQAFREQSVFRKALGHMCHRDQAEFVRYVESLEGSLWRERVGKALRALEGIEAAQRERRESWDAVAASLGALPAS